MNRIDPSYSPFVGAWKLVTSEFKQADGTSKFPLGAQPQGRIFYSAQGQMAAQLMRPDRPRLSANDVSVTAVTDLKAAFDGYTAYFGAYTIDTAAGVVTHHVEGSLLPNWIGKDLVRFYEFSADGRVLTLSTPPMGPEDARVVGLLVWERLDE